MPRDRDGSFEPILIAKTDEVEAETLVWQNRPLEAMYPVVFCDASHVKICDDDVVPIFAARFS